jgi:uncharacterized membrane protein YagU involved in acid resistance
MSNIRRTIITTTATAGTLDLLSAFVFSAMNGHGPIRVLQSVASGPFGQGMTDAGTGAALAGLLVHYSLMTIMVSVFVMAATHLPLLTRRPVLAGLAYGFGLYLVMYWIVLPLRYPAVFPQTGAWQVGNALFSHLICVGLPIGLISARVLRRP